MSEAELTIALDHLGVDPALCNAVLDDPARALTEYDLTAEEREEVADLAATMWLPDADDAD